MPMLLAADASSVQLIQSALHLQVASRQKRPNVRPERQDAVENRICYTLSGNRIC